MKKLLGYSLKIIGSPALLMVPLMSIPEEEYMLIESTFVRYTIEGMFIVGTHFLNVYSKGCQLIDES